MPHNIIKKLHSGAQALGLDLLPAQQQQLIRFLELLQQWGKSYNLTAIRQIDEMVTKHLLDSLSVAPFLFGTNILDVGSGAGLPGIPLAVYYPHKHFVLIDSNAKKTRFLLQVKQCLQLTNLEIVKTRVEAFSPAICFTTVLARAFADLATIVNTTQHLCCCEGVIVAMKGRYPVAELAAIDTIDKNIQVQRLQVPNLNSERHVVIIRGNV